MDRCVAHRSALLDLIGATRFATSITQLLRWGAIAIAPKGPFLPTHLDVHVPDPLVSLEEGLDPEQQALLADSVGLALLVVLETLAPAERLAFVLHDMFDVPFDEIAPIVERSPAAARQLASRARRRIKGAAPVPDGSRPPASRRRRLPGRRPRR